MKALLILYPIQPYVDVLIGESVSREVKLKIVGFYQTLIQKRYPGFQKILVMFSDPKEPTIPDLSQLLEGFVIQDNDIVGACGISFANHCKNKVYPKNGDILKACPQSINDLVIGGFHLWDCVDKVAGYAYKKGINVLVDEDLTELFFFRVRNAKGEPCLRIPFSRKRSLAKTRKQLARAGSGFLEDAREERAKRPWLAML